MRAKRSLGQNFLVDGGVVSRILDLAGVTAGARILEIGPGRGALTEEIVFRRADCVALEKDDDLAPALVDRFGAALQVVHGDALEVDLTTPGLAGRVVIGNLPYNVAVPILRRLLDVSPPFPKLVLMFQREVAERLAAGPGTKQYGIPSLLVRISSSARLALSVPPGAFRPPPKIQSAVVVLEPLSDPPLAVSDRGAFLDAAAAWFRYRRKTIRNGLLQSGTPAATADRALEAAGIPPTARPETLDVDRLIALWQHIRA
ncbi:MAG: 16S rRNA (adenine(1518)-N(6)/adenine(1519)-N(6))-dimethyltransferase RsmA [Pseudomonadota bacterium]